MGQTVLIIKEEAILAVSGKEGKTPQLKELEKAELTGYGENMARWKEGIRTLCEKLRPAQVRLVLPASVCAAKVLQLPYVKKKELEAMAVREMQENFRSEIMDYAVIQSDRKSGILLSCASVEEAVLKQLLDICTGQGVEVKSVTAPMEGVLRILPRLETYQSRTAIFLFFEEGAVTSVLSEMGEYKYSSRSRLFSEPGTLDFGTEIVRNVSGILQFHATAKSEHVITEVYYAGCPADVFDVSREELSNLNLHVEEMGEVSGVTLPGNKKFSEWLPCVGAMLNGVKEFHDINLLSSYRKSSEQERKPQANWKHVIPPAVTFGVCLALFSGVLLMNAKVRQDMEKTTDWMESEKVKTAYTEALALEQEKETLLRAIGQVRKNRENRSTYPKLNRTVIDRISEAGGAGITSKISVYDSATGQMNFEARSEAAIDIPAYILRLTQTGLFYSVEYTGYVFENNAYTLSLLCTLEGNEEGGTQE